MSKTKQCRDCFKYKPLQEIRPSSTSADGYTNQCYECMYNYKVQWRIKNQASILNSRRKFAEKLKNGERPHRLQAKRLRTRNSMVIKAIAKSKMSKTRLTVRESTFMKLFGCSSKVFIARFEQKFNLPKNRGMGWHNYGAWQMDHKKPMREFALDTEASRKLCNHYMNLRPEWALNNMRKHSKYAVEQKNFS